MISNPDLSEYQAGYGTIPVISHFQAIRIMFLLNFNDSTQMDLGPFIHLGLMREQENSPCSARIPLIFFIYFLFIYLDPTNISIGPKISSVCVKIAHVSFRAQNGNQEINLNNSRSQSVFQFISHLRF